MEPPASRRQTAHLLRVLAISAFAAAAAAGQVLAACECLCVDGRVEAVCASAIEARPVCPPAVCPVVTPSVRPVEPPAVAPVGATRCVQQQVFDPATRQYEWRRICR